MRVLHVVEVSIGGVITVVNVYSRWQVAEGHDVHVLAPDDAGTTEGTRHSWRPQRRSPGRLPAAVRDLRRLVHELQPDVVHLHSFFPGILGRVRRLDGARPPAVVYQPHSWAYDAAPTALGRPLVRWWEKHATRLTDAVIVNCSDELDEGRRHGVTAPIHVVGMPVDTVHFAPASPAQRTRARADLGLGERSVLLCVGRLTRQKGQDRLIEAWCASPPPGAVLVLLGAGDPTPLRTLAGDAWGDTVVAPGAVDDVRPWLHGADLVVAPSRWESQEVAVSEALACGRSVVATEVNGAREALEDGPEGHAGRVVGQDDLPGFLAACRTRLLDQQLRHDEELAARQRAERMFALDAVMRRVDATYEQALHSRTTSTTHGG